MGKLNTSQDTTTNKLHIMDKLNILFDTDISFLFIPHNDSRHKF